jgi:hypothetical protein
MDELRLEVYVRRPSQLSTLLLCSVVPKEPEVPRGIEGAGGTCSKEPGRRWAVPEELEVPRGIDGAEGRSGGVEAPAGGLEELEAPRGVEGADGASGAKARSASPELLGCLGLWTRAVWLLGRSERLWKAREARAGRCLGDRTTGLLL